MTTIDIRQSTWVPVCSLAALTPERGVAALVGSHQVALFLLGSGELFAVDHKDPFTGANVIARGIVGTRGDEPTVASPLHKQVFSLRTGQALDYPGTFLHTWAIRVHEARVEVLNR